MRENVKRKLKVPDVVGLHVDNARLMLSNAEFSDASVRIRFSESYRSLGSVLGQSPARGAIVDADATIELQVSERSWIRHLPGVYQRAGFEEHDFLREFLWIPKHIWEPIERVLAQHHTYFDPLETPVEFLDWLASWVAFRVDASWPETKKRALIKQAMELYKSRGTVEGIRKFLSIFTGCEPTVLENRWPFKGFRIGVHSTIGKDSVVLPPVNRSHCFIVEIPMAYGTVTDDLVIRIHDILMHEKPAHTTYFLRFRSELHEQEQREMLQIGVRSGIGIGDEVHGTVQEQRFVSMGDV